MIEPDPSIANPDHTWRHVVGDVGLCPKLSPLVVNLDRITAGQPSRYSVDLGYPKLGRSVVFCQRLQSLLLEAGVAVSDLVLIPTRPSALDIEQAALSVELCERIVGSFDTNPRVSTKPGQLQKQRWMASKAARAPSSACATPTRHA